MIAVAVCTYKRLDYLARLLAAFAGLRADPATPFVIVDNHGEDPTVGAMVREFAAQTGRHAIYVVEKQPGISAARNAAFAKVRELKATTLAMLDDDEWPPATWLDELLAERDRTGAQVVGGPVRPVFSEARSHLRRHARFWSVERDWLQGKPFVYCTCNFLVEMSAVAFLGDEPFDPAYGTSGGGDTVFFRALARSGVSMAWTERAWINEEISDSRASVKWLRQRRYRAGNVAYRWEVQSRIPGEPDPRLKTLAILARLPFYPLISREKSNLLLAWLLEFDRARGRVAAAFGGRYMEYARDPAIPAGKACH